MREVKFGSKEWFDSLKETVTFPSKFAIYYDKKRDLIRVTLVESKANNLDNIKWGSVKPTPLQFHPEDKTALITVEEIQNSQDYYKRIKALNEIWCAN
ncbi:hypothetical protein [Enterococcus sp.]|uniref:hypothetical protein n=1 Tax=Enterococcus sp. TaxID=35783 RepID=UPI002FC8E462